MDINLRKFCHCKIKCSSFFHWRAVISNHDSPEHLINMPYLDKSLNFPSRKKSTSYFRSHLRTTIPTSSELWNRRLPKGCYSGPNKRQSDWTRSGLQGGCSRTSQQNYCTYRVSAVPCCIVIPKRHTTCQIFLAASCPCDFNLIPKMKEPLRGIRFKLFQRFFER